MRGATLARAAVELDGSTLEGGGQLLRVALSLASLTGIPIHISRIRGRRGPISSTGVGKDGGLKPAHLAAVKWLAKATAATTQGMEARSTDLLFQPTRVMSDSWHDESQGIWNNVYENGTLIRRQSYVPMPTAGSILLILQAVLRYLLFSPSSVPLRISIEGGTNVSKSPSIEYISHVLLPMLSSKLGIKPIIVNIHHRGWSVGQSAVGSISFDVTPITQGCYLTAPDFSSRGEVENVHVCLIAPEEDGFKEQIKTEVFKQVATILPGATILTAVDEDSGNRQQVYLLLVAETSSGFRLGRDYLFRRRIPKGHQMKSEDAMAEEARHLVSKVARNLKMELSKGGCVDEYLEDQLVVFQALAKGKSTVDAGSDQKPSLHTQTARWVVENILGISFSNAVCDGIGFRVQESLEGQVSKEEAETM